MRSLPQTPLNLIWHAKHLREADWLRNMLGDVVGREISDLDLACFEDNSIHVVSSNWRPLSFYENYFLECRARCKRVVLFHASDEFFSGGYQLYRHFDLVVRNFHTYLASGDGILTIPEGYPNDTQVRASVRPADARRYAWSFVGEIKASRVDMAAALANFRPQRLTQTASISDLTQEKLSKSEYDSILADSVFSPCPMGNVILETWRLYESLELGCIPLVETRASLDYFRHLFGPNPIPAFRNWTSARGYAEALFADTPSLLQEQARIQQWWTDHKAKVRAQVRHMLAAPSFAQQLGRFAARSRNRFPLLHQPLRLSELLRHQTVNSLARRLRHPGAPLSRVLRDSRRQVTP